MKIYTRTGDDGTTGLFGGARVHKASTRVVAYGTIDEANAILGWARSTGLGSFTDDVLQRVQNDLFTLGAELACAPGAEESLETRLLEEADVERLERAIDSAATRLSPLQTFILPAGCPQATALHMARTVCRRAERTLLAVDGMATRGVLVVYLNRLSDLLFVLARLANLENGVADVPWSPNP
jgi:cob(I)alamin adenosyltransferase